MPDPTPFAALFCRALRRLPVALAAASLCAGCAGGGKPSNDLKPGQPLLLEGYSFMPPADDGWMIVERGPDHIVLAKPGKYAGEAHSVRSARVPVPQSPATLVLVNHVRALEVAALPAPRFRIRTLEVEPAETDVATCARAHVLAEDREPGGTTGPIVAVLLESFSLTCREGDRPGSAVRLGYMHRAFPEDRDPGLRARAQAVTDSLILHGTQR